VSTRDEFFERVRAAAEGTPYVVTETEKGFDVTLDVVDAQWYGVLNKAGVKRVFSHHVRWLGDDAYSITDESRSLEWVAGAPRIAASAAVMKGRIIQFGARKVWAFDAQGHFGVQAEYRFDSREGRDLIEGVAAQLGLKGRIVVAVLALAGAL
jgi:hypothetical protein